MTIIKPTRLAKMVSVLVNTNGSAQRYAQLMKVLFLQVEKQTVHVPHVLQEQYLHQMDVSPAPLECKTNQIPAVLHDLLEPGL